LLIIPPEDNGGVVVSGYKVWGDVLQTVPSYTKVYEGNELSVVIDATTAGLSLG